MTGQPLHPRLRRPSARYRIRAYGALMTETFKASSQEYFSIRSRAVMRILSIAMDAAVFGFIGVAMSGLIDLGQYGISNGAQFVLSGVIVGKLVGLGQVIQPFWFRGNYSSYHNTPFNTYFMSFVKNFDIHYFMKILEIVVYASVAWTFFDLHIAVLSLPFLLVLGLGLVFQLGLNLFANGWMVVTKHGGDPVNWFYDSTRRLFSGEIFPVGLLPGFLVTISKVHPQTRVNSLARDIGIAHKFLGVVKQDLLVLLVMSVFFLALGALTLRFGLADSKRKGTLKW